jgi:hypothetical protein
MDPVRRCDACDAVLRRSWGARQALAHEVASRGPLDQWFWWPGGQASRELLRNSDTSCCGFSD